MPTSPEFGWPGAMKRRTAAAYFDMSEAAFEREIVAGWLPASFMLSGRAHWSKAPIDRCLDSHLGAADEMPEYRRKA